MAPFDNEPTIPAPLVKERLVKDEYHAVENICNMDEKADISMANHRYLDIPISEDIQKSVRHLGKFLIKASFSTSQYGSW